MIEFTPLHALHSTCFPSSSNNNKNSSSWVIMLSFPFKSKCFFSLHSALQENANTDLFARCPLRTKGYLCVEYPERLLCGAPSIFKSGPPTAMVGAEKSAAVEEMRKRSTCGPSTPLWKEQAMPPRPSSLPVLSLVVGR